MLIAIDKSGTLIGSTGISDLTGCLTFSNSQIVQTLYVKTRNTRKKLQRLTNSGSLITKLGLYKTDAAGESAAEPVLKIGQLVERSHVQLFGSAIKHLQILQALEWR